MTGRHLVSAAEAARRLGVNKSTMTRWIAAGKVPAVRTPGGQWRLRAVDVEALSTPVRHRMDTKRGLHLVSGGKESGESPAK